MLRKEYPPVRSATRPENFTLSCDSLFIAPQSGGKAQTKRKLAARGQADSGAMRGAQHFVLLPPAASHRRYAGDLICPHHILYASSFVAHLTRISKGSKTLFTSLFSCALYWTWTVGWSGSLRLDNDIEAATCAAVANYMNHWPR